MSKDFDVASALYLAPFVLFHAALLWSPAWLPPKWGFMGYWVIAAVLLLPWLKARAYPDESLGKIVLYELSGIAVLALVSYLRHIGGRLVDAGIILTGAITLIWFAVHERRKNRIASKDPPA